MTDYSKVFIYPDLTEAQRLQNYKLRKERDELNEKREPNAPFRYAIRGDAVVKFKATTGQEKRD